MNDLICVTDYTKQTKLFIANYSIDDSDNNELIRIAKQFRQLLKNKKGEIIKSKSRYYLKIKRNIEFMKKYYLTQKQIDDFIKKLYETITEMMQQRKKFTQKNFFVTSASLYVKGRVIDKTIFLVMTQPAWSYLKQYKQIKSDYIDELFLETEYNKKMREIEIQKLYNKTIQKFLSAK